MLYPDSAGPGPVLAQHYVLIKDILLQDEQVTKLRATQSPARPDDSWSSASAAAAAATLDTKLRPAVGVANIGRLEGGISESTVSSDTRGTGGTGVTAFQADIGGFRNGSDKDLSLQLRNATDSELDSEETKKKEARRTVGGSSAMVHSMAVRREAAVAAAPLPPPPSVTVQRDRIILDDLRQQVRSWQTGTVDNQM